MQEEIKPMERECVQQEVGEWIAKSDGVRELYYYSKTYLTHIEKPRTKNINK